MKKLILAAAIVCAAAMSQGAMVAWDISGVVMPSTSEASIFDAQAYCFITSDSWGSSNPMYLTIDAVISDFLAGNDPSDTFDGVGYAGFEWGGNADRTAAVEIDLPDIGGAYAYPVTLNWAVVIVDSEDIKGRCGVPAEYYQVMTGSTELELPIDDKFVDLTASNEWQAFSSPADIPEPTSGLLMLIGMGAMALRRKRA